MQVETLQSAAPSDKIARMKKPQHLFILGYDLIGATDFDTILSITKDLDEMDLYRLPYDHDVFIQVVGDPTNPGMLLTFGPLGEFCGATVTNAKTGESMQLLEHRQMVPDVEFSSALLQDLLIALLATKNIEKSTRENKLRKLGIGKNRGKFDYTTTISLPKDLTDDPDNPPLGTVRSPHLRRGHIRRQHYGSGNEQIKKIWIAPIFVNADPAFVGSRRAYRIG